MNDLQHYMTKCSEYRQRIQELEQEVERLRGALEKIQYNAKQFYVEECSGVSQRRIIRIGIIEIARQALEK